MFRTLSFSLLAALGGLYLASCSQQQSSPAGTAAEAGGNLPSVTKQHQLPVDSLNGVPGHRFGQPLSTFHGLMRGVDDSPQLLTYYFPSSSTRDSTWFGKHRQEVEGVFYQFRDGKLAAFRAIAYSPAGQAALAREATFLFGPGTTLGDRTEWSGEQAWAVLATSYMNARTVNVLDVGSRSLQAEQEQRQQAQLKAENAGR